MLYPQIFYCGGQGGPHILDISLSMCPTMYPHFGDGYSVFVTTSAGTFLCDLQHFINDESIQFYKHDGLYGTRKHQYWYLPFLTFQVNIRILGLNTHQTQSQNHLQEINAQGFHKDKYYMPKAFVLCIATLYK